MATTKRYKLIGSDGKAYESLEPGQLGGHREHKIYGRLDCRGAQNWIAKGYYVKHRVFFADEATAIAAGYRPCAGCLKERYVIWKQALGQASDKKQALAIYREKIMTRTPMN